MAKKTGVKRGSAQHQAYMAGRNLRRENDLNEMRSIGVIKGQEDLIIALGRMGWGPARLAQLSDVLAEVVADYKELSAADADDKGRTYTLAKYDQELNRYLDSGISFEECYGSLSVYTEGIRRLELQKLRQTEGAP